MPTYPFVCGACESDFDVKCPISVYEHGGFTCPDCGSTEVQRSWQGLNVATSCVPDDFADPKERRFWRRHKRHIEAHKHKFDTGAWELQKPQRRMSAYEPDFVNHRRTE